MNTEITFQIVCLKFFQHLSEQDLNLYKKNGILNCVNYEIIHLTYGRISDMILLVTIYDLQEMLH